MPLDLLAVFAAGVATLATPCVLPMLPVYLTMLLGEGLDAARASDGRRRLVGAASLFVAGFASVFTALGFAASWLGALLHEHRTLLLLVGGAAVVLFGLRFLGVLRLPWLERTVRVGAAAPAPAAAGSALRRAAGSFAFGVVFALGWTPCVGPILGSVLTYTATATAHPVVGGLYLLTYALGVGLPLVAVSAFAERAIPLVRRLNRHLGRLERVTGAALVAVGLSLAIPAALALGSGAPSDAVAVADEGPVHTDLGAATDMPRFVEFYSKSCPVCERLAPKLRQLESDCVERRIELLRVDVGRPENRALAQRLGISAVPAMRLYDRSGAEVGRLFGDRSLDELRAAAAGLLPTDCAGVEAQAFEEEAPPLSEPTCASALDEPGAEATASDEDAPAACGSM